MAAPHDLARLRIPRDAAPAPRSRAGWRWAAVVTAAAVLAAVAFTMRARSVPVARVITATASAGGVPRDGGTSLTANGYVVARTKASVAAKIPGRLAFLGVSEGSAVQRGAVLARLDNSDLAAAVAQAQANLASAEATVIETTADRDQLRRDAERVRDIRARNAELVSPQELELAMSRALQAEARYRAAAARRRGAEAGLRLAVASYENTVIRAPFTGTVLRKDAEVGEVVAPSVGGGLTRGAVVTMADLGTLEVEVDVNEAYIGRLARGQPARITLDAYPDTAFRGTVRQIVPTADRQRATVQVKVSIDERDPRILPEMGAKVDFLVRATGGVPVGRSTFRVPTSAVRGEGGASIVWIVRDGRLVRRRVETGPVSAGFLDVRSGLNGGEQLLIGGVDAPVEGMRVRVQ